MDVFESDPGTALTEHRFSDRFWRQLPSESGDFRLKNHQIKFDTQSRGRTDGLPTKYHGTSDME